MAKVFLLNGTVVFWPERNVLHAKSDETKRIALSNPATRCLLLLIQRQGQVIERDYFLSMSGLLTVLRSQIILFIRTYHCFAARLKSWG